ncbi:class I SAM-dependent methyltransferase [Halocatena pleomorpha]|uniref:Class I SAM-dependent methyltransferase n=2 Tax=Halocatena pleomorpha TaxID=1785090 RepID=A0A3P3RLY2_9EURY|nr:class I SAM-dependent methyltransferase [Halocatena pleomorpha]
MTHADPQYLDAKRSIDRRALSSRVRERLLTVLPDDPRVLEAGCGTGTMVARLHEWGVDAGTYRGVDRSLTVLEHARDRLTTELDAEPLDEGFRVAELSARFEQGDALSAFDGETADLLIAASFLDLVPVRRAFDAFEAALRASGFVYAPLTFDGSTIFQPDHPADAAIEAAYHAAIDERSGRDAHAGRHVLDHLRKRDGRLLSVGSSDWIVRPRDGTYPGEEQTFLAAILGFVEDAVNDHPEANDWLETRRRQLDAGTLSYTTHQYDFLYQTPEP